MNKEANTMITPTKTAEQRVNVAFDRLVDNFNRFQQVIDDNEHMIEVLPVWDVIGSTYQRLGVNVASEVSSPLYQFTELLTNDLLDGISVNTDLTAQGMTMTIRVEALSRYPGYSTSYADVVVPNLLALFEASYETDSLHELISEAAGKELGF